MARSRRTGAKRQRDYKAEYKARVAKGIAAGKTRQQARGHARGETKAIRAAGRQRALAAAARRVRELWPRFDEDASTLPHLKVASLNRIGEASDTELYALVHSDSSEFEYLEHYGDEGEINPLWYHKDER